MGCSPCTEGLLVGLGNNMRGHTLKQIGEPGHPKRRVPTAAVLHRGLFMILLYASLLWFVAAYRRVSVWLLLWVLWSCFQFLRGARTRLPYAPWLVAFLVTLLPVDVSLHNALGLPRFVSFEMGLPGPELIEAAARGEVLLGGCMVTGYEARWVWVW